MGSSLYFKDCSFVKVILASTKVDSDGYKLSLKALSDLKNMCINNVGKIIMCDIEQDCKIVYSFIDRSCESDGDGGTAYVLYGIVAFSTCGNGVSIDVEIENLGANLYDVARISYTIGQSEKMSNDVKHILGIDNFLYFSYNVRSKDSIRNQEKLNDIIKKSDTCPFCGSKPIVTVDAENISGLDKFNITIKCVSIKCSVQPKTSFYDYSFTTACDMALKHWNHRTSDSGIIDEDFEKTDSKLTKEDICINCVDCANLKQNDDFKFYCDRCEHGIRDVFTNTCESFIPQGSKTIHSFDYCDKCISYDNGYCKKRKRETNKDLWMPCCQHNDKSNTDTRCCVNCVNCCKYNDGMYYCINDKGFIPGEHPFRHTGCDDFEQKDSDNLYCVSSESASETETVEDRRSLCLSCVNAEFDKDGCFCKHLVRFVKCVGCRSCQYYEGE